MGDFVHEENALLRQTIRNIVSKVKELQCTDPLFTDWNNAINETLTIISEETGLSIEEILNPKCN